MSVRAAVVFAFGLVFGFVFGFVLPQAAVAQNAGEEGGASGESRTREAPSSLTLDMVLESVEQHYPQLVAADADVRAAEGDLLASEGGFDPTWQTRGTGIAGGYHYGRLETRVDQPTPWWGVGFFGSYRLGRGTIPPYYGEYYTGEYGALRAGVEVPLWRNGPIDRRRATLARSELGRTIAGLSREQQRIEVRRLAVTRYWEWLGAVRRFRVIGELLETARVRDGQILERVERGDLPRIEHVENRRVILQREGQLVTMRRALEQATIALSLFVRDREGEPLLVDASAAADEFPEPVELGAEAVRRAVDDAITARPEARRLRAQREQASVEARFAANQAAPEIDVLVAGSQHLGAAESYPKLERPQIEVGIFIDIPLRNRAARGREQQASAMASSLDAQSELAEDRIRADVRDASSALTASIERLRLARGEYEVAVELERGERQRLELGSTTMLIVNLREQAAAEAAVRIVDALVDYQRSVAAFEAATGVGASR